MINPEKLNPEAEVNLGGRWLKFRQRRFQDGRTVYDCVDAQGCFRTYSRDQMAEAKELRDRVADARHALILRCDTVAANLSALPKPPSHASEIDAALYLLNEVATYLRRL